MSDKTAATPNESHKGNAEVIKGVDIEKTASTSPKDETQYQASALTKPEEEYDDPRKWPLWRKLLLDLILNNMVLSLTFSSSAYSSSMQTVMRQFGISQDVFILGVALFVLGFAVGPLLFGPLAHILGRRPIYIVCYIFFTAWSFGASEAPSIAALLIFRFLAGVLGSVSINNVPASIGDYNFPQQASTHMAFYALAAFGGPGLGPLIASFVDHRAGWRWNMRVQAIYVAICTIACILFVPETHHDILKEKARKQRQKARASNGQEVPAEISGAEKRAQLRHVLFTTLSQPFYWLVTEPVVAFICFYLALLYSLLYLHFVVVPTVFLQYRHFSEESNGLIFISLLIGFLIGMAVVGAVHKPYLLKKGKASPTGLPEPEDNLQQVVWACFIPPIGLFIFAWTATRTDITWVAPCIGIALFSMGCFLAFTGLIPYLVTYGGTSATLVLAASTFTRPLLAAGLPVAGPHMYRAMTVAGGTSMLAGVAILMIPMTWLIRFRGHKLRAMSKRARK